MKVIKRNGRTEEVDISKIRKYTTDAVAGLSNVNVSELEFDAQIQFRDGITTAEIQDTLIKTAVDKIDVDLLARVATMVVFSLLLTLLLSILCICVMPVATLYMTRLHA